MTVERFDNTSTNANLTALMDIIDAKGTQNVTLNRPGFTGDPNS